VRSFRARGAEVTVYATRRGADVPADLADLRVVEHRVRGTDTADRERSIRAAAAALDAASAVLPPYPHSPCRQQEGFARLNPPLV